MKTRRSLVVVLLCIVLSLYYTSLYIRSDNGKTSAPPSPSDNLDVFNVFMTVADLSGDKQAVINIAKHGKYALPGENYTFDYKVYSTSFKALQRVKNITGTPMKPVEPTQWDGYLKIHEYSEELSKVMRVFLAVPNYPGFQKMRLTTPRFNRSGARSTGPTSFDAVYNFDELNQVYSKNGYPPLVLDKEYDDVCKHLKPIGVLAFVPPNGGRYGKDIREKIYGKNGKRWINCDSSFSGNATHRKFLCTTFDFDISVLRQSVLKDVKCIEVQKWGDRGGLYGKSGPNGLSPDDIFHYFLNPSDVILNEVDRFTTQYLERPYVAIHIRANHINVLPTTVKRCFVVAMRLIDALKRQRGVKSVYISTDMNKYGCRGAYVRGYEEYLANISGAVRYNPKTTGQLKDISPTMISVTNVLLLSKSDHLIAMGTGSFHGYVMGQFLKEHFEKDPKTWSLTRMCENARARGMTRPSEDYSKWET